MRSGNNNNANYGVVYVNANNASSNSNSNNGSRLKFKVHRPCFSVGLVLIVPIPRRRVATGKGEGLEPRQSFVEEVNFLHKKTETKELWHIAGSVSERDEPQGPEGNEAVWEPHRRYHRAG